METILIRQVRVTDPQSSWNQQEVDLLVQQGRIADIQVFNQQRWPTDIPTLHAPFSGLRISPGWVDLHAHLQSPGHEQKETLAEFAEAAIKGGFTQVCAYPHTIPIVDHSLALQAILRSAETLPIHLHLWGKMSHAGAGQDLAEMYDLHLAGAKGFSDGLHPVENLNLVMRAIRYVQSFEGLLVFHPYAQALAPEAALAEGLHSLQAGLPPEPPILQATALAQLLEIFSYLGGRFHLQPLTNPRAIELLQGFNSTRVSLTSAIPFAYLALDSGHLTDFDATYKVFPSLPTPQAKEQLHTLLQQGAIQAITSGHLVQGLEEKEVSFSQAEPGMLGFLPFFPVIHTALLQPGIINWNQFVQLVSITPRSILGLPTSSIEVNNPAELTCFHPDVEWQLAKQEIPSTGQNTPYLNQFMQGKVMGVYHQGNWHDFQ